VITQRFYGVHNYTKKFIHFFKTSATFKLAVKDKTKIR